MKSNKEFVASIVEGNQALFKASQLNVAEYFNNMPDEDALVEHFVGRMVNERMNMVEISNNIASMPADADPIELQNLTKQANDEAIHFRLVKEVIEHIKGEEIDVAEAIAAEEAKPTAKGASLLEKYDADSDPAALAAYQLVAEGRAEAVWNKMAECIQDEYVSTTYAKIAKDEGFHANIGARSLALLATDEATQARVEEIARTMRMDLFAVSCMNTTALPEAKKLIDEAYSA